MSMVYNVSVKCKCQVCVHSGGVYCKRPLQESIVGGWGVNSPATPNREVVFRVCVCICVVCVRA